ncbi:MAG: Chorismate dehydratase [Verrucomicrobiae bacterium]|nr:Chorismate dehydratase [Verrucomicrobiae bacterium]
MNWRIGSVPFLNARPLIFGIEEQVTLAEPARLADLLYRGQFDAALVPVAEVLAHDRYDLLDGVAIASDGRVDSVILAHRDPVEKLTRVAVTPVSRTSVWLLRVLLKGRYGITPEFYPLPTGATLVEHPAMLMIGDEAIWYRMQSPSNLWDLGAAWKEWTGLPFVYAAWALQRAVPAGLRSVLRNAQANGLAHLEEIVQDAAEATASYRREYLTRCVSYHLGELEKQGLRQFQLLLKEYGLIESVHDLRYVS